MLAFTKSSKSQSVRDNLASMQIIHRLCTIPLVVLSFSFLLPSGLRGEGVTREEFVAMLEASHPVFNKERLASDILAAERKGLRGVADWKLSSSLSYSREEPTLALTGPERTDAWSFQAGVTKQLWGSGGQFSVTNVFTRSTSQIAPSPFLPAYPGTFYDNSLEVQYSHPLLKNRGGVLTRLQFTLKSYDIDVAGIEAEERIEDFLADALLRYLDWVYLEEQQRIARERLELSEKELVRTQRKYDAYLVDSTDVIRASDAVNIWKQNLGLIRSGLGAVRRELSVLLQEPRLGEREPHFDLYSLSMLPTLTEARQELVETSRILHVLRLRKEQLGVSGDGARHASRPDLSLVGAVALKNGDEAFAKAFEAKKTDAALGLQLQVPLENTSARADIERNRLQLLQIDYEADDVRLSLESSLASLHEQLVQLERVLALNREQIASAELRTREEMALYEKGRGDLTFVIMSRDSEEAARLTYAENAVNYQKLWVRYQALLDKLYEPVTFQ